MAVTAEPARRLDKHLGTIQGNILHGYRAARAWYLFYGVSDVDRARAFLGELARRVETALPVPQPSGTEARTVVNVALTSAGLRVLGVDDTILDRLPEAFRQPMAARAAALLDDRGASAPAAWDAGLGDGRAHVLVMLNQVVDPHHQYPTPGDEQEAARAQRLAFEEDRRSMAELATRLGLEEVHAQPAELLHNRREHFGWADGLSQPAVEGALGDDDKDAFGGSPRPKDGPPPHWRPIKAGEFVHGYIDEDGSVTEGPTAELLLDGTFMVYRKLYQDILGFRLQLQADADAYRAHLGLHVDDQGAYELMAAKVVGRWRDGKAVTLFPQRPVGYLGTEADEAPSNDFRYWDDPSGEICPLGAHIRRTNPRDAIGWKGGGQMSERHRIIRRGMPYGPFRPWDPEDPANTTPDDVDRGLIFICFNADIERQFEVVQRQWCNDGNLFGLGDEKDYLLGDPLLDECGPDGRSRARHITIQRGPGSPPHLVTTKAPVVSARGSEYLLVPGTAALHALACGGFGSPADPAAEAEAEHVTRVVALAKVDLARQYPPGSRPVQRDQHPRAHGLVAARFVVADDVPPALQVGVLAQPGRTYDAWIRFSSRAGGADATDEKRDAHGMAIKLLGVEGEKVLADEADATTQDFVLANSPVFFCRDAEEYVELATKSGNGRIIGFFVGANPLRWRLRALRNLLRAVGQRVESPLDIRYWSQTPFDLGPQVVKYSAVPQRAGKAAARRASGRERIGDTMAAQLAGSDATFDFLVQLQGDPDAMPIEDPTVRWDEGASPFRKVASIQIPKQDFRSDRRRHLAEHLSFTPWHALEQHRPLGSINRVRRAVYAAISAERHARNEEPRREPTELEDC